MTRSDESQDGREEERGDATGTTVIALMDWGWEVSGRTVFNGEVAIG
jgi:hypothetical protein